MNKTFVAVALAALSSSALIARAAPTPFVDVPSCHWASTAVAAVASQDVQAPAKTAALAQNAVRQVFEGFVCGSADYASRFVTGAPAGFSTATSSQTLRAFNIVFTGTTITGNTARVGFRMTATVANGNATTVVQRTGTVQLTASDETGWKVVYSSLVGLNLPFLPR
jgi:hypothetical protein